MNTPTLGDKLGLPPRASPLLRKAQNLGLDADGLERLAIARGCDYYSVVESLPTPAVSEQQLSNEELAIALLNPSLRYHPQSIRLGAAMLGAEGIDSTLVAHLARLEQCEALVRYVAEAGRKFEPENRFWRELLALLPTLPLPDSSVVPHPTRFVAMTGITRRGVETVIQWIRPHRAVSSHG